MKLIKKLPGEKIRKSWRYYGLFLCPYCNKEVKRERIHGIKQKSCGCSGLNISLKTRRQNSNIINYERLYRIYWGMKQRCYNKKYPNYKNYGGRGIKIYDKWNDSFIIFKIWAIIHGYKNNLTIERINNDKGYSPNNCKWIPLKEQAKNRRSTKLNNKIVNQIRSLYFNIKISQKLLGKIFNVDKSYISYIVNNKVYINK